MTFRKAVQHCTVASAPGKPTGKEASAKCGSGRLVEVLESRRLFASIVWTNRGSTGDDADQFEAIYGSSASTARGIVSQAIADWSNLVSSFSSDPAVPDSTVLNITVTAEDLSATVGPTTLGVTFNHDIGLDDNAAGAGWYFDPKISNDTEFSSVKNLFQARDPQISTTDFYTVALHEVGHALGLNHSATSDDLMNAVTPTGIRRFISDEDATTLHANKGYQVGSRAALNSFGTVTATEGTYSNKVRVSWSAFSDAASYDIFRLPAGTTAVGSAATPVGHVVQSSHPEFSDTDPLALRDRSRYFIRANYTGGGAADFATSDLGYAQSVNASDGLFTDHVHITWPSLPGVDAYDIYRLPAGSTSRDPAIAKIQSVAPSSSPSYDDVGGVPGTKYRYVISAHYPSVGNIDFAASDLGSSIKKAVASTVTATLSGTTLRITGTSGSDKIGLDLLGGKIRVAALALGGAFATFSLAAVKSIVIDAGASSDKVDVDASVAIDTTIIGGSGNDVLLGGSGDDSLEGDRGNDRLIGRFGSDVFSGGAGNDSVEYGDRTRQQPVTVSLDGVANDGGTNERDQVGSDIENILGGLGNDTLTGNSAANILVGNRGADSLSGLGGNDTLVGFYASRLADGAVDTLDGGYGDDILLREPLDTVV